jgi:hypothetical protein
VTATEPTDSTPEPEPEPEPEVPTERPPMVWGIAGKHGWHGPADTTETLDRKDPSNATHDHHP